MNLVTNQRMLHDAKGIERCRLCAEATHQFLTTEVAAAGQMGTKETLHRTQGGGSAQRARAVHVHRQFPYDRAAQAPS